MVLLRTWLRDNWLRLLVHVGALAPAVWLAWMFASGSLYDPVRQITSATGRVSIVLLVLTLACTPVYVVFGWRRIMRVRRALGLYTFLYVAVHLLVFAWWDYGLKLDLLVPALLGQEFVVYGLVALLLLIPLAVTSTRGWRRRLGRRWQWVHWLFYPAALLAAAHFLRIGKDPAVALRYAALVVLLLVVRLGWVRRGIKRVRSRLRDRRSQGGAVSDPPTPQG